MKLLCTLKASAVGEDFYVPEGTIVEVISHKDSKINVIAQIALVDNVLVENYSLVVAWSNLKLHSVKKD
jgi:hypothetical protein